MNLRRFRILALAAAAALGLPAWLGLEQPAQALQGKITLQSGGAPRTALVVENARLKKARRAVLIVLRNGDIFGSRRRHHGGLGEAARGSGALVVYPDAAGGKWSDAAGPDFERDAQFITDLVNKLVAEGVADRRRIFLTGTGTGGLMAMRLVCQHSEAFAGAAAILAGLPADLAQTCHPSRPIRFMLVAATADPLVPFHGGKANLPGSKAELLGAEETLAIFGKAAGCGDGKTTSSFHDRDSKDGTRAFADRLKGCKVPIELVRIEGGGHALPDRSAGNRGELLHNYDIDAGAIMWDFFRRAS
jgi:polyhydroxybutyrate depolymerase